MIKAIILVVWGLIIANLFIPFPATLALAFKILGVLLVVAHVAEYFLFKDKVAAQGDSPAKAFLMTLVFGIAYFGQS